MLPPIVHWPKGVGCSDFLAVAVVEVITAVDMVSGSEVTEVLSVE